MVMMENEQFLLRDVEKADASDMFDYYRSERVCEFEPIQMHKNIDETLMMIEYTFGEINKKTMIQKVIDHKASGKVIGDLQFYDIKDGVANVGFMLHPNFWGLGIMKEAFSMFIRFGFRGYSFRRIQALCEMQNVASAHVMQNVGFQREGVLRSYMKLSDEAYHTMYLYALLKKEYKDE